MLELTDLELLGEIRGAKIDVSRTVNVPAKDSYLIAVNPVDARKYLLVRTTLNEWFPPPGKEADTITWIEKWQYIERRQAWFRVIEVSNSSSDPVEVTVHLRAL